MPRGYRILRSHACACGQPDCKAWGSRKYNPACWKKMPPALKEKILTRAMQQDIGLDVTDLAGGPPMKRMKPREWDEQPY